MSQQCETLRPGSILVKHRHTNSSQSRGKKRGHVYLRQEINIQATLCKTITSTSPFHTKVKTNPHKTFFLDGTTFKGVDNQVSLTVWTPDSVPVCPFCRVVRTINHNVFVSVVLPINETSQSLVFCVLGILLNSEERSMYRSFCQSCYF